MDAPPEGVALTRVEPAPADADFDLERRLAMVVDLLDFDHDRRVIGRDGHGLLEGAVANGTGRSLSSSRSRSVMPLRTLPPAKFGEVWCALEDLDLPPCRTCHHFCLLVAKRPAPSGSCDCRVRH